MRHLFMPCLMGLGLVSAGAHAAPIALDVATSTALPPGGGSESPEEAPLPEAALALASADFDADGMLDIASLRADGSISVALADASGRLVASNSGSSVHIAPFVNAPFVAIRAADLDLDGNADLLVSGSVGEGPTAGGCGASVLWGSGDGSFVAGERLAIDLGVPVNFVGSCTGLELGDYDQNGVPDFVLSFDYQPLDANNGLNGGFSVFLGQGEGAFAAPKQHLLADDPGPYVSFAMTSADFDGDGTTDLGFGAEIRWLSGPTAWRLETFHGDGAGQFSPAHIRDFECTYCELIAAKASDFSGDGRPDVVIATRSPDSYLGDIYPVLLLLNEGDGSFREPTVVSRESSPVGLETEDFTADGVGDLLLVDYAGGATLFPGMVQAGSSATSEGVFAAPERFLTGGTANASLAADYDGDGLMDLAVLDAVRAELRIASGSRGARHLTLPVAVRPPGMYGGALLSSADFNRDGVLDVLVTEYNRLLVLLGTGEGSFVLGSSIPSNVSPWPVPIADLDADGILDLVLPAGDGFEVARGTAEGGFLASSLPAAAAQREITAAALGDIDADGDLDLAAFESSRGVIELYLNDGALHLTRTLSLPSVAWVVSLSLTDLNADGRLDLFVGSSNNLLPVESGAPVGLPRSGVWFGDGQGGFDVGPALDLQATTLPYTLLLEDVDRDGALDVLSTEALALGNGDGSFQAARPLPSAGAVSVALLDLDGDARLDLVSADYEGLNAALGDGTGGFGPNQRLTYARDLTSLRTGDFVTDGLTDLVAIHTYVNDSSQQAQVVLLVNAAEAVNAGEAVCGGGE
jgi:VCBS repeat protein